jgi:DNA helicase-2/ATP-dependent DNA helicase PcrA
LLKPLELFREHPEVLSEVQESIQQMMVDEFQDTNEVQMSLISQIVEPHKNVAVVGDDDQSIYGWRGACVSNILDFPKSYKGAEVIRLERNYRSTPAILDLANESIKQNTKRHGKVLRSGAAQDKGEKPELFILENEEAEAEFVVDQIRYFKEQGYSYKDIAVLYRSNSQGGLIESFLRRAHIDYSVSGGSSFFDRKEIKDVLSFLRCSVSPHEVALRRIINTPPRGIGDATIEKITEFCEKEKLNFVKTARNWRAVKIFEFSPKKESHQITLFHEEEAEFHESHGISVKAGESLDKLFKFFDHLPRLLFENPPVVPTTGFWSDRMLQVFNEKLNYRDYIYQTTHDPVSAEKKWQLFEIFSRVFEAFVNKGGPQEKTLCDFVDAMELRDESTEKEDHLDKVQLLTLHACKGLEFPVCIMVGLEEDVIPHKTLGSDIDEERRLFYVGLTRAEERLVLSRCKERRRHGSLKPSSPSRFIVEVCKSLYKEYPLGNRPVTESERESLVANFLASLDKKTPNSPPKRN